ncbi:MAG: hypothetical protein ABSG72_23835 [Candidatus Sulfotelmatobacter sp.]|jgi:hypothetical protein
MFRLNTVVRYALLIPALAFPQLSDAQGGESPKIASADEAVSAVDHGDIKTEFCARAAFQLIERLPKDEAIPILIRHLGFREPLTNAPRSWQSLYPAVDSLARVGLPAESPLIEFLAQNPGENSIEDANAITALGLIRHGDVVPTIKLLRRRNAELAGTPAAQRLDAAAREMLKKWCWSKQLRQRCEERLRQPD